MFSWFLCLFFFLKIIFRACVGLQKIEQKNTEFPFFLSLFLCLSHSLSPPQFLTLLTFHIGIAHLSQLANKYWYIILNQSL